MNKQDKKLEELKAVPLTSEMRLNEMSMYMSTQSTLLNGVHDTAVAQLEDLSNSENASSEQLGQLAVSVSIIENLKRQHEMTFAYLTTLMGSDTKGEVAENWLAHLDAVKGETGDAE